MRRSIDLRWDCCIYIFKKSKHQPNDQMQHFLKFHQSRYQVLVSGFLFDRRDTCRHIEYIQRTLKSRVTLP